MLTQRGWWFVVVLFLQVALGAALSNRVGDAIVVVGLSLLAWFLWEWAQFAYRFYYVVPRLTLRRELRDERKAIPILWADGEFDVEVAVRLDGRGDLPYAILTDWVPTDGKLVGGTDEIVVAITASQP